MQGGVWGQPIASPGLARSDEHAIAEDVFEGRVTRAIVSKVLRGRPPPFSLRSPRAPNTLGRAPLRLGGRLPSALLQTKSYKSRMAIDIQKKDGSSKTNDTNSPVLWITYTNIVLYALLTWDLFELDTLRSTPW